MKERRFLEIVLASSTSKEVALLSVPEDTSEERLVELLNALEAFVQARSRLAALQAEDNGPPTGT